MTTVMKRKHQDTTYQEIYKWDMAKKNILGKKRSKAGRSERDDSNKCKGIGENEEILYIYIYIYILILDMILDAS